MCRLCSIARVIFLARFCTLRSLCQYLNYFGILTSPASLRKKAQTLPATPPRYSVGIEDLECSGLVRGITHTFGMAVFYPCNQRHSRIRVRAGVPVLRRDWKTGCNLPSATENTLNTRSVGTVGGARG